MKDFKQARIYKIVSPCGLTYYGATTRRICDRMKCHVSDAKANRGRASQRVIEAGGEIYLVEMYPCNSQKELDERESWYIKYRPCVNEVIPGRTRQQHYQDNRERLSAYKKQYRKNNREQISAYKKQHYQDNREQHLAYKKQPYNCECGSTVRTGEKARHFKTTKHRLWVENNQQ